MKPVKNTFRVHVDRSVFKKDVLEKTQLKNRKKAFKAAGGNSGFDGGMVSALVSQASQAR